MTGKLERNLDRALAGKTEPAEEVAAFIETARQLEDAFDLEPPVAARERALFAAAVAARGRTGLTWGRLISPVVAGAALVAALAFASGSALPGDALYPVRRVLQDVGLNEGFLAEADHRIERARALVTEAEGSLEDDRTEARTLAIAAIQELAPVEELLEEVDLTENELGLRYARLDGLIRRATTVIAVAGADKVLQERSGSSGHMGPKSDSEDEGSSGAGGGNDDSDENADHGGADSDPNSGSDDEADGPDGGGDPDPDDGPDGGDGGLADDREPGPDD